MATCLNHRDLTDRPTGDLRRATKPSTWPVIAGLVPAIHVSAHSAPCGAMGPGDKHRDDTCVVLVWTTDRERRLAGAPAHPARREDRALVVVHRVIAILVFLLPLAMTGCATEPADVSAAGPARAAASPVPAGKARIVLTRESSLVYVAAPATVTLNGKEVTSVGSGGSASVDVPAGESAISVSAWSYPGASTVKVALKAGQTTTLAISPRSASVGAAMLLGPLGGLVDGSTEQSGGAFDVRLVGGGG